MPTATVRSVGTSSRDYSTMATWEAGSPSNLVTADEIWKGEFYNDSEFGGHETNWCTFSGVTTDNTRFFWATTAAGQGFKDDGSASSLPLRYDQSKGVGIRSTGSYPTGFNCGSAKVLVEGFQCFMDTTSAYYGSGMCFGGVYRGCIFETRKTSNVGEASAQFINSVLCDRGAGINAWIRFSGMQLRNCTVVRPSDLSAGGTGVKAESSSYGTIKNTAVFGYNTNFADTIASYSGNNNASNSASVPGTSPQTSLTYANQFENTANSTRDWRVKSGNSLENNGARDQGTEGDLSTIGTNDKDILGRTRSTSTPTIGAWEVVSAGGGVTLAVDSGTLTLTNETLTTRYDVAVEHATIEAVGQTIGVAYVVPVTSGTVELVGQDVAIQIGGNLTLAVDSSNLDLVGQDVVLRLSVAVGEATAELAGQSVGLNYSIPVSHGTLELLGQDVGITLPSGSVTLTVDSGTLQLTGSNILITLTGVIGVEKKFGLYDVDPIFFQATPEIQWAIREFHKIREQFEHGIVKTIPILAVAPEKPYEGMLVGADGTNWDPGSGRGAYEYINGGWAKL